MISKMENLPNEILFLILEFNSKLDLMRFRRVEHKWKNLIEDKIFFKDKKLSIEDCVMQLNYYHFVKYFDKYFDKPMNYHHISLINISGDKILCNHYKPENYSLMDIISLANYYTEHGNLDIILYLKTKGFNFDEYKNYVLMTSAEYGHMNVFMYAINNGANIHSNEDNAFRLSACNGHFNIVKYLLENGVDVFVHEGDAITSSAMSGHINVLKLLLDHADLNIGSNLNLFLKAKNSALNNSVYRGHTEIVKLLLDKGADPNTNDGCPLFMASLYDKTEIVKLLIDHKVDIHMNNECALKWSADNGYVEIVKLLLTNGANIHVDNDDVLKKSAKKGDLNMINLLLENGANKSALHALQWSLLFRISVPFHQIIKFKFTKTVENISFLLKCGLVAGYAMIFKPRLFIETVGLFSRYVWVCKKRTLINLISFILCSPAIMLSISWFKQKLM
jgi:ankyrin repeat protein